MQEPIALYSPWATAMPGLLSYGLNSGSQKNGVGCQSYGACKKVFTELLSDAGLLLKYSIDSDQVLFESLFEELNRRRVTVGADSIALIGEWDSFYARSLPLTFSAAACRYITDEKVAKAHPLSDALTGQLKGKCATTEQGIDQFKTGAISPRTLNIRQYSYLSGLDGEASVDQGSPSRLKGDDKDKEKGRQARPSFAILLRMNGLKGLRNSTMFADWWLELRLRIRRMIKPGLGAKRNSKARRSRPSESWGGMLMMRS